MIRHNIIISDVIKLVDEKNYQDSYSCLATLVFCTIHWNKIANVVMAAYLQY